MLHIKKQNEQKKPYDLLQFKVISLSPIRSLCLDFGHRQMKLNIDVSRNKI